MPDHRPPEPPRTTAVITVDIVTPFSGSTPYVWRIKSSHPSKIPAGLRIHLSETECTQVLLNLYWKIDYNRPLLANSNETTQRFSFSRVFHEDLPTEITTEDLATVITENDLEGEPPPILELTGDIPSSQTPTITNLSND
jgi:hypothetical protein